MAKYGVEYDGFAELIVKVENLGVSMDEVADKVLDEVAPAAVEAFRPYVPYDAKEKDGFHARNNVKASKTRSGYGGRYKLIGVFNEAGSKLDWSIAQYLFFIENGTSKMTARPFMHAAQSAVKTVIEPRMKAALENEVQARLEG